MKTKMEFAAKGPTSRRTHISRRIKAAERRTGTVCRKNQSQPTSTAGEVLSDGSFVELVRDGTHDSLLRWSNTEILVAREIVCGDVRYSPTAKTNLIRHLPKRPIHYHSTEALFTEVAEFIEKNSGLDSTEAALLAFLSFSSFFCDCLSLSPCLLLYGAPLDAISLLRVLACVCRHPLLSVGSSVGGLPSEFRPTRLICQVDARINRQLAALQFSGFGIIDPQPRHICGASVIYIGDSELRSPFADVCLQVRVPRGNRMFGSQDEDHAAAAIASLQNRMLMYRLTNHPKVKASEFDIQEFCGVTREYARILGRCVANAPDLQARLGTLLLAQDRAERTETASALDAVVIEALVVCCHERKASVHVGEVATLANAILGRGGETVEMNDRQVGGRMKRLGFRTTRLDAGGRGIYLLNGACERVHKFARAFDVPTLCEGQPGCPYCKQM